VIEGRHHDGITALQVCAIPTTDGIARRTKHAKKRASIRDDCSEFIHAPDHLYTLTDYHISRQLSMNPINARFSG
jgi:hypothetical protein